MNPYTKLQFHLERHAYKRGANKGQAPADPSRRGKNHFRVVRGNDNSMRVRMYATDLITVYEDNRVVINTNGYSDSQTTRANLNYAMHHFLLWGTIGTEVFKSHAQPAFTAHGKKYRYYDGMTFTHAGELTSEAKPFQMRRIDRDESKEFTDELKESGFKAMWPVLFATCTLPEIEHVRRESWHVRHIDEVITSADHADKWPIVIALYKFPNATSYWGRESECTSKEAWNNLMAKCKRRMYVIKDSDVTQI